MSDETSLPEPDDESPDSDDAVALVESAEEPAEGDAAAPDGGP